MTVGHVVQMHGSGRQVVTVHRASYTSPAAARASRSAAGVRMAKVRSQLMQYSLSSKQLSLTHFFLQSGQGRQGEGLSNRYGMNRVGRASRTDLAERGNAREQC